MQSAKKQFTRALFIFRRDLRLDDNTGLLFALKNAESVVPVFIFDKKQIDPEKNKYFGSNCVQFMCESLEDLDAQLQAKGSKLNLFYGQYPDILNSVLDSIKPDLLCLNIDYTVYSKQRDSLIERTCSERNIVFRYFEDITLLTKAQATAGYEGDGFAKKFTPFYNRVCNTKIRPVEECKFSNFSKQAFLINKLTVEDFGKKFYQVNDKLEVRGGRKRALAILANLAPMKDYNTVRDDPTKKTTQLSAYNKFGCASIREVYFAMKQTLKDKAEPLIRQLYWRDFYYFIAEYFPHIFKGPMKPTYARIPWEDDPKKIEAWKTGTTGCPIIDASMRHLNAVGFMPNRCRMIVSNYLVKDLHVNWQIGEQYFANKLVDYDPAQNNGGWQWSAGCGVDSQPYFRIFNPVLQMEKFDPECKYIKTWVPELKSVPAEDIHNWEKAWSKHHTKTGYPKPIIIHEDAKKRIVEMYKESFDLTEGNAQPAEEYGAAGKSASLQPRKKPAARAKSGEMMEESDSELNETQKPELKPSRKPQKKTQADKPADRAGSKTRAKSQGVQQELTQIFKKKVKLNDEPKPK